MKKVSFLALALTMSLAVLMSSCSKENTATPRPTTQSATAPNDHESKCSHVTPPPPPGPPAQTCGTATVATLQSGQTAVGTVTVVNDATNLYVTYVTTGSWSLRELRLYVGDLAQVPMRYSSPDVNSYPYTASVSGTTTQYTFTIPLAGLSSCFVVSAEASVSQRYECSQTAWAAGTSFTPAPGSGSGGSNCGGGGYHHHDDSGDDDHHGSSCNSQATYFSVCKQSCTTTCIQAFGFLYNGENPFPNGASSVVVGGYTYTQSTASIILTNANPSDAKTALFLVATLKVYGNTIYPPTSVTTASTTVENWLATLGQLTENSQFTAPANIQTAIAVLQTWETSQTCN